MPKFFVGSLGRFGVLAEITFKVFPRPGARRTLEFSVADDAAVASGLMELAASRWEPDAIDARPLEHKVYLRLAAPEGAIGEICRDALARRPGRQMPEDEAAGFWTDQCEFRWAHPDGVWLKIASTPARIPEVAGLAQRLPGTRVHVSAGGNLVLLSLPDAGAIATVTDGLCALGLPALTLRGDAPLRPGAPPLPAIAAAVKAALDPDHRFPAYT